jgi:putative ABC transport system substrate-binding protein
MRPQNLGCLFVRYCCWLSAIAPQRSNLRFLTWDISPVSAAADAPRLEAFRQGLRELGYIEGQNILIEYRHESRGFDPLPALAAELLRLKIDVLVAVTTNAALAAKKSTSTVPIVFMGATDPISAGLAETLT